MTGAMNLHGRHLHVDCASGAAGDMMLGALIDLGVPVDVIGAALDAIGAGRARLRVARVVKHGIAAVDVKVDTSGELDGAHRHVHRAAPAVEQPTQAPPRLHTLAGAVVDRFAAHSHAHAHGGTAHAQAHARAGSEHSYVRVGTEHNHVRVSTEHSHVRTGTEHGHARAVPDAGVASNDHGHGHADHTHEHAGPARRDHAHYHYATIRRRIAEAELNPGTRQRALDIFDRIARAEATLHGTTVDSVAFHEVGAIDSVVDVVGTAAALDWLAPASVSCASVAMGYGTVTCAHGVLPVPAPAALEILRDAGGIMTSGGVARELCTPTGAAILAASVTQWVAAPTGRPLAVGWGAGDSELTDRANVLRAVVVEVEPAPRAGDSVWQIDANIDDMSPELCGPALEAMFAAGALDAWWTPITMKKGRPALTISALASADTRAAVTTAILRETTTIGVRYALHERTVLSRSIREVQTPYGAIAVKVAADGEVVMNVAPELDACVAAARRHGVPVKLVFAAAIAAFDPRR